MGKTYRERQIETWGEWWVYVGVCHCVNVLGEGLFSRDEDISSSLYSQSVPTETVSNVRSVMK